ncbi:hypothetical protein P9112_008629 [Eukaryota sp. TZLM1-RC]
MTFAHSFQRFKNAGLCSEAKRFLQHHRTTSSHLISELIPGSLIQGSISHIHSSFLSVKLSRICLSSHYTAPPPNVADVILSSTIDQVQPDHGFFTSSHNIYDVSSLSLIGILTPYHFQFTSYHSKLPKSLYGKNITAVVRSICPFSGQIHLSFSRVDLPIALNIGAVNLELGIRETLWSTTGSINQLTIKKIDDVTDCNQNFSGINPRKLDFFCLKKSIDHHLIISSDFDTTHPYWSDFYKSAEETKKLFALAKLSKARVYSSEVANDSISDGKFPFSVNFRLTIKEAVNIYPEQHCLAQFASLLQTFSLNVASKAALNYLASVFERVPSTATVDLDKGPLIQSDLAVDVYEGRRSLEEVLEMVQEEKEPSEGYSEEFTRLVTSVLKEELGRDEVEGKRKRRASGPEVKRKRGR